MSSRLLEFLETSDGAMEILATIEVDGTSFSELDEQVGVSHDTLSTRLDEARELGLVDAEAVVDEGRTKHRWVLTGKGVRVRRVMESVGLVKNYDLLQMSREFVENDRENVLERIDELEQEVDLDDEVENEKALHSWKQRLSEVESSDSEEK